MNRLNSMKLGREPETKPKGKIQQNIYRKHPDTEITLWHFLSCPLLPVIKTTVRQEYLANGYLNAFMLSIK